MAWGVGALVFGIWCLLFMFLTGLSAIMSPFFGILSAIIISAAGFFFGALAVALARKARLQLAPGQERCQGYHRASAGHRRHVLHGRHHELFLLLWHCV